MSRCDTPLLLVKRVFVSLLLSWTVIGFSTGHAQTRLSLNLDLAVYRYTGATSYLEIYYALPVAELAHIGDAQTGYTCQALMTLQVFKQDSLWAAKQWKFERKATDLASRDSTLQMVDVMRYIIEEAGVYRVVLYGRDVNRPERIDSAAASINVRGFSESVLTLSDVQLATEIRKADSASTFVKNHFEIIPNPGRLFGEGTPTLFYYFEGYNLLNNVPGDKYKARCFVKSSSGTIASGVIAPDRTKKKMVDAGMEMGMINVAGLPSGTYSLVYGVADLSGKMLASGEKKFYVYNPAVVATAPAERSEGAAMLTFSSLDLLTDKQLDDEFAQMDYLTSRDEKKFYKNLQSAGGKRQFIHSIWDTPKPTIAATGAALRQEYLQRVEKANAEYTTAFRAGWKTDRGRVYILYGAPTNIERFPSTLETKPYEIWTYHALQNGVDFIFADRYGFKNYELMHSTLRGELSNPNWRDLINTNSATLPQQ